MSVLKFNLATSDRKRGSKMKGSELFGCAATIFLLVGLGFWFYLLYQLLSAVNASPAMWTAYWVYFPVQLVGSILSSISNQMDKWE